MSERNDGGAAFPMMPEQRKHVGDNLELVKVGEWPGMSLRDYFAAAALQGILACQSSDIGYFALGEESKAAQSAYAFADAMLAERNK